MNGRLPFSFWCYRRSVSLTWKGIPARYSVGVVLRQRGGKDNILLWAVYRSPLPLYNFGYCTRRPLVMDVMLQANTTLFPFTFRWYCVAVVILFYCHHCSDYWGTATCLRRFCRLVTSSRIRGVELCKPSITLYGSVVRLDKLFNIVFCALSTGYA